MSTQPPLAWYDDPQWNRLPDSPPPRRGANPWLVLALVVAALVAVLLGIALLANQGQASGSTGSALVPSTSSTTARATSTTELSQDEAITAVAQQTADEYGETLCFAVKVSGYTQARDAFVEGFVTTATNLTPMERGAVGRQVFAEATDMAGCGR